MMYAKLIVRNAKRSIKDYLIYITTMTICVMLFYSFLSVSSKYYSPDIGTEYDFTLLSDGMKIAICTVTLLLLFLIKYVNNYMLRRKQKEFAIQSVMGMEQHTIGWLFFGETLAMGAISIILGIFLGMVCSQFITAMLLSAYGRSYQFIWTLYPDTVILTVCFFIFSIFTVGFFNLWTIGKTKIIDMLTAERQNEPHLSKSRFMPLLFIFYLFAILWVLVTNIRIKYYYFDTRFALPVHFLFWGNIIVSALVLLWSLIWFIKRKHLSFRKLIAFECIFAILNAVGAAYIPYMREKYMLSYNIGVMNQYILFLVIHLIYLICGILFLTNSAILSWKDKSPEHRYKGENLFLLGQITSKLATNTKTMILICITFVLSIFLFIAAPVLTEWSLGYLNIRSMYDIQISTRYNKVYNEADLPIDNYEFITDFLAKKGIETSYNCTFSLYLPNRSDFHSRAKWEFPVVAISLSDFNAIRNMLGYKQITLNDNEFTTQWHTIINDEERDKFIRSHTKISTDAGSLTLSKNSYYKEPIGETVYNSYTDVLYVFPDKICKQLLGVMRNRFIITPNSLSFADAQSIEKMFTQIYPEDDVSKGGAAYTIRTKTLQVNSLIASNFILKAAMIYGAVVLMVICLTVLALQQLLDTPQYRYRFRVLHSIGVEEKDIGRLILKQLGIWFGIPIILSILISGIVIVSFLQTISAQVSAYIGIESLLIQIAITISILTLLFVCYFISTWILFKRSIRL